MIQRTVLLGIRDYFVFFLFLAVFLCVSPSVLAAPKTGWVDLHAQVPEGFNGSVSVALEHKQTGETQIVTCYSLNDYANSVQIPVGEYAVMSAFTSEDSFIYEATTKTEKLILSDEIDIEVTVTYNPEGERILDDLVQGKNETPEITEEPTTSPSDSPSVEEETQLTNQNAGENSHQEEMPPTSTEEETDVSVDPEEKESPSSTVAATVRNILLTAAATLAFLFGTILFVVYIRTKFGSD